MKSEIRNIVQQLENCRDRLPPSVEEVLVAGKTLLLLDDDLLVREHARFGRIPALAFMAAYAIGETPREPASRRMTAGRLRLDGRCVQSDMFGPWQGDLNLIPEPPDSDLRCGNCIYWSQGGVCLAHYRNLVMGTGESPNAGKETQKSDTCRTWYEGEGLDLDDGYNEPDPRRPASLI